MSRTGFRRFLKRNTLDDSASADDNNKRYWEAHRANYIDPFILPPAGGGVIPQEAQSVHYVTQEPLNDLDSSNGDDSRRTRRPHRKRGA